MTRDSEPGHAFEQIGTKPPIRLTLGSEVVSNTISLTPELIKDQKQAAIREFITTDFDGEEPDAIFPFSGGIVQRENGKWDTLNGSDLSEHGQITIGRTRVIAGAEIARTFPNIPVVTNSYNRFDPNQPTMASVVKDAFVRRKIDPERIKLEEESFTTITQFTEMIKMATREGWKKLAVVTNGYHVPRATAQYENLDTIIKDDEFQAILKQFKEAGGNVSIINADTVMSILSDHFTEYLNKVKKTEGYKKTVESEAQGLKDLKAGKYRVVLNPENPRDQDS